MHIEQFKWKIISTVVCLTVCLSVCLSILFIIAFRFEKLNAIAQTNKSKHLCYASVSSICLQVLYYTSITQPLIRQHLLSANIYLYIYIYINRLLSFIYLLSRQNALSL